MKIYLVDHFEQILVYLLNFSNYSAFCHLNTIFIISDDLLIIEHL